MKDRRLRITLFLYIGIFLLALYLRAYRLGELPYGLHIDEAGMGYDALSLSRWGLDRYYKFYPVYFINYGGGQSVLYGYFCALLLKFFPLSTELLRVPAVCFGMLTWFFGTQLIRENIGEKEGLFGAFLLAVCPCFILHSRMALDCYLFSGASTVSLYLLSRAVKAAGGKKAALLYILSGAGFGITLYTYALSWLVIPVFLVFLLAYLLYLRKITWKQILCMGIPLGILAFPLILMVVINSFQLPEIATAHFTIPRMTEYRGVEVALGNVFKNIPELLRAYFFYDGWIYNSVPHYFTLYVVSIPFCVYGIGRMAVRMYCAMKEKKIVGGGFIFLWFAAQTCMGLLIAGPNGNKMNAVFFSLIFFTVIGITECCRKKWFAVGIVSLYLISFVGFGTYYFGKYTEVNHPLPYFWGTYAEVLDEWEDVIGDREVYVDSPYIYYPLGEQMSPMEFQLIEQGMSGRENVSFGLPKEPDENGFYIIFKEEACAEELVKAGFTEKESGIFKILYQQ